MNGSHFVPAQRRPGLPRPQLVAHARSGNPDLMLLRGSEGTGKTALAIQIAESFSHSGYTIVWVRFVPSDAGVAQLWHRIFSSVAGTGVLTDRPLVHGLAEGEPADVTPCLLGRVFQGLRTPMLLVLDDAPVAAGTDFELSILDALEATPNLTILMTARGGYSGLTSARARTRALVREIDAAELVFSLEEVEALVALRDEGLSVAERTGLAEAIYRKSGGWTFAAHSMVTERETLPNSPRALEPFSFVRELVDFLLAERDHRARIALCATALLDEFSAATLSTMLEISGEDAQTLIDHIFESSFGYWEDESGTRWYRHQDIVRDELRVRAKSLIGTERSIEMCARVAPTIGQERSRLAVQAAIMGESWEFLSDCLIRLTGFTTQRSRPTQLLSDVPSAVRERYPVIAAFALIDEFSFPRGRQCQVIAEFRHLSGRPLALLSATAGFYGALSAALRMMAARLSGNEALTVEMAERVQQGSQRLSPEDLKEFREPLESLTNQAVISLIHAQRWSRVERVLEPMLAPSNRVSSRARAHSVALAAWASAWQGKMQRSREQLHRAVGLEFPLGWRNSYMGSGYRIAAALEALERGSIDEAETHLAPLREFDVSNEHWPFVAVLETLVLETRFGPGRALDGLQQELEKRRGKFAPVASATQMLLSLEARLMWQSGRVLTRLQSEVHGSLIAVFAALSRGEASRAVVLSSEMLTAPDWTGMPGYRAELLLLHAESARQTGNLSAAEDSARRAASLLQEYCLSTPMRVISRAAAQELAKMAPELATDDSIAFDVREVRPLTKAERRAFRAVVEHGNVQAAANGLFLSADTVKGHMKQVYRKLGVKNRAEAIQVAGDAGMLWK